jgi:hypothetical protein
MAKTSLTSAAFTGVLCLAAHGVPSARAATWWTLNSASGSCVPSNEAVRMTRDPAFVSPFALDAEMRQKGRQNHPIEQKRTASGSAYAVFYDGMVTPYFTTKGGREDFVSSARSKGNLP